MHQAVHPSGRAQMSAERGERDQAEKPDRAKRGRRRRLLPVILGAAAKLFTDRGFEQTTLNQVAGAAGVTKTTLYVYFAGKADLIDAVLAQWLHEMSAVRPRYRVLPLGQQLVDLGLQVREMAASSALVSLTKRFGEIEQHLSPQQLLAWRMRFWEFESHIAEALQRYCGCERPSQTARQFLSMVLGDSSSSIASSTFDETQHIESAVELVLRAYPGR